VQAEVIMSGPNTVDCEQALELLLEFIDGELPEARRASVEQHLQTCRSCFSRMEFESRLKRRLSSLAPAEAPAGLRDRIRDLIKKF
jgi:anti-sigma factor (TIGR02949 family)